MNGIICFFNLLIFSILIIIGGLIYFKNHNLYYDKIKIKNKYIKDFVWIIINNIYLTTDDNTLFRIMERFNMHDFHIENKVNRMHIKFKYTRRYQYEFDISQDENIIYVLIRFTDTNNESIWHNFTFDTSTRVHYIFNDNYGRAVYKLLTESYSILKQYK